MRGSFSDKLIVNIRGGAGKKWIFCDMEEQLVAIGVMRDHKSPE